MSWIIPCLLLLMIYTLFRRCYIGIGSGLELVGAFALCIIFSVYMIGFAVGAMT